jgi:hypothetical protein
METTYEPLHLDKWSLMQLEIMDIPTSFIWIITFFIETFEHGNDANLWGCVGSSAQPLSVEFCNYLQ